MPADTGLNAALAARPKSLTRRWPSARMGWKLPALAAAIMLALWLTGIIAGHLLLPNGQYYLPLGKFHYDATWLGQMLSWDGIWYLDVARHGYEWHPSWGTLPGRYQSIDFYPLYPAIERVILFIAHSHADAVILLPGIVFGVASVFAFHRLALSLLTPVAAARATALYAVWPATVYFAMGYPTGLINLCAIASLGAYAERRFWRAAFWAGLGTAAAPTIVFLAAGLCLDQGIGWLRGSRAVRDIPRLIGFGLLSVSGLLVFIAYQVISFHDPFASIKAQDAWGAPPPFAMRLARFIDPRWYFTPISQAAHDVRRIFSLWRSGGRGAAWLWSHFNEAEQSLLNGISLLAGCLGLLSAFRFVKPLALPLAGLIGMIGYLWFIATTDQNITAAPRLIFPALMIFAGLGILAMRSRTVFTGLFCIFSILTICNAAFAAKGYFLV